MFQRGLRPRPARQSRSGPHPCYAGPWRASPLAPLGAHAPSRERGFAALSRIALYGLGRGRGRRHKSWGRYFAAAFSSSSITALNASSGWAPEMSRPFTKNAGVPVTPAASPAFWWKATRVAFSPESRHLSNFA